MRFAKYIEAFLQNVFADLSGPKLAHSKIKSEQLAPIRYYGDPTEIYLA